MILVTGATGTIGRKLVRQLQISGVPFRALVRSEDKGEALGCNYAVGDFDQPLTLAAALEGVDALFLNGPAGDALVRQQTGAIELARAAGVKRVVKISSRGADVNASNAIGQVHGQVERFLAESDVSWSVLRPGTFMQNLLRTAGTVRNTSQVFGAYKDGRISFVDCEDIAACGLALLRDNGHDHQGQTYTLSGPEAVSYYQIVDKLAQLLDRPVSYVDLPPEQMVASLKSNGMPARFAEMMVALMVQFSTGAGAHVTPVISQLLGRPARSIDQFLADNIDAFR